MQPHHQEASSKKKNISLTSKLACFPIGSTKICTGSLACTNPSGPNGMARPGKGHWILVVLFSPAHPNVISQQPQFLPQSYPLYLVIPHPPTHYLMNQLTGAGGSR